MEAFMGPFCSFLQKYIHASDLELGEDLHIVVFQKLIPTL